MLALLAALMLTDSRVLPNPFLSTEMEPVLSIAALQNLPRERVTRGSSWRVGGYVRVNYYYRLKPEEGPTFDQILREPGFSSQEFSLGPNPGPRAVRIQDGIRQVVSFADLESATYWRWADLKGPGKIVVVSEIPLEGSVVKRWHSTPELLRPPLPPNFPPKFAFLENASLMSVISDPIIPRSPRVSFAILVKLASPLTLKALENAARRELDDRQWDVRSHATRCVFGRKGTPFGLISIELLVAPGSSSDLGTSEILATYLYCDSQNAPRLTD